MRANYSYVGSQWATLFDNAPLGDYLGARKLLSAQATYGVGDWTFTAYGTNLTNEAYVAAADPDCGGPAIHVSTASGS